MPKKGFRGNRRVIGAILQSDPGVAAALESVADEAAARSGGTAQARKTTDRQGFVVLVDPEAQAVDGVGTKAFGSMGMTQS